MQKLGLKEINFYVLNQLTLRLLVEWQCDNQSLVPLLCRTCHVTSCPAHVICVKFSSCWRLLVVWAAVRREFSWQDQRVYERETRS